MKNRILLFDIARSLCVIWIVAFWHMLDYFGKSKGYVDYGFVTIGVLSCFTFLSGLFVGKKKMTAIKFYKERFKRFWLLLLISALSFYVVGYIDNFPTFIGTITGLSCLGLPWARTLWYFSMLILFYLLTPLFLGVKKTIRKRVLLGLTIYVAFCGIAMLRNTPPYNDRVVMYFPYYLLGIVTPLHLAKKFKTLKVIIIMSLSVCVLWGLSFLIIPYSMGLKSIAVFLAVLTISSIIESLSIKFIDKIFLIIAYIGMCAYLFHRQVYGILTKLSNYLLGGLYLWEIPVMIFILLFASYYIQFLYDKLIKK